MDRDLVVLYRFVVERTHEAVRDAEARGDELARRFALGSRRILDGMHGDLAARTLAAEPAVGYLVRAADRFGDHPELPRWLRPR